MSRSTLRRRFGPALVMLASLSLAPAWGCARQPINRIYVETFDDPAQPNSYVTDFSEAYFSEGPGGALDIVLRWQRPAQADPTQDVVQIVHARAFWRPRYGTTRAEESMINATLELMILTPPTGVGYEGAGFLTFKLKNGGQRLDGQIESGELAPNRLVGGASEPFGPARIRGRIRARRDRRRVVQLLQEAHLLLGFDKAAPAGGA